MEEISLLSEGQSAFFVYSPQEIITNLAISFILGMVVSYVYKSTHKGLSYSQSFMLTIVFITVIVAMVMMVIGNSLSRAFALVGALSIIRFRTVVKDTKDTAFVFLALACGMAAGTSNYFLAIIGAAFFSVVAVILYVTNYGSLYKSEFILMFRAKHSEDAPYSSLINGYSKRASLLHTEPSDDGASSKLTFDLVLRDEGNADNLSRELATIDGISEVTLVASKTDVDY